MDASDSPSFTSRTRASWHLSPLGGVKRRGRWQMSPDMRIVTLIGGADLDLTEAELPEAVVLTKVSIVGGVSLRVPEHVDVVVEGFHLFGGVRVEPVERATPATVVVKVRNFGLASGVHVERAR